MVLSGNGLDAATAAPEHPVRVDRLLSSMAPRFRKPPTQPLESWATSSARMASAPVRSWDRDSRLDRRPLCRDDCPANGTFTLAGQTYGTTNVVVHDQYDPNHFGAGYDIAILILDEEIQGVTPMSFMTDAPVVGEELTLVGYGHGGTTNHPIYDFPTLREGYTELEEVDALHIAWYFDGDGEQSSTHGDSGGPSFVERDGELVIAGVTSGGNDDPWTPARVSSTHVSMSSQTGFKTSWTATSLIRFPMTMPMFRESTPQ